MAVIFHAWPYGRFIEILRKKLYGTNQGSIFVGGSFSNRDNVKAPIQFRRVKVNPSILKDDFSSRKNPSIFNGTSVVRLGK